MSKLDLEFKYFVMGKVTGLYFGRCYAITMNLPSGSYSEKLRVRGGTVTKFDTLDEECMKTFDTAAKAIEYIEGEEFGLLQDLMFHLYDQDEDEPHGSTEVAEKRFELDKAEAINYFKEWESKDGGRS